MKPLALLLVPLSGVLMLVVTVVVLLGPSSAAAPLSPCVPSYPLQHGWHLDREQWASADTIVAVGRHQAVPERGWLVGLSAALQESGLRSLPYGDRDSLGLFQQRSAWGTVANRMSPVTASTMFYTGGHGGQPGLLDITGWQRLPIGTAAQAVQRSAYPDAYAKWVPLAQAIVKKLTGHTVAVCPGPGRWTTPVQKGSYVLTAGFGQCGGLWEHCHTGLDFAAPIGTPAMAASDGVVVFSGWGGRYGNLIKILHPGGIATWYAHLSKRIGHIGQRVRMGEVVGLVGDTGNTTGPHLHFEVRVHATATVDGTPVDPKTFLEAHHVIS